MAQELKAYGMNDPEVGDEYEMYKVSEVDAVLAEKDSEIADLKQKLAENDEKIDKQKWRGDEWAKACNQKDNEIESLKASHYTESVDAGMENRRLQRALWIARAKRAIEKIAWFKLWNTSISTMNPEDGARQEFDKWKKNLGKFLAKAEEYK